MWQRDEYTEITHVDTALSFQPKWREEKDRNMSQLCFWLLVIKKKIQIALRGDTHRQVKGANKILNSFHSPAFITLH